MNASRGKNLRTNTGGIKCPNCQNRFSDDEIENACANRFCCNENG